MLVLSRKIGESIVIGDDVYCTVVGIRGRQVRLAFDAPKFIPVHREEIQHRINRERQKDHWFCEYAPSQESIVQRLLHQFKPGLSLLQETPNE